MIKTWQQRCEEHPDHNGIVSDEMIRARMQEEIDELRAAIETRSQKLAKAGYTRRPSAKSLPSDE